MPKRSCNNNNQTSTMWDIFGEYIMYEWINIILWRWKEFVEVASLCRIDTSKFYCVALKILDVNFFTSEKLLLLANRFTNKNIWKKWDVAHYLTSLLAKFSSQFQYILRNVGLSSYQIFIVVKFSHFFKEVQGSKMFCKWNKILVTRLEWKKNLKSTLLNLLLKKKPFKLN